jgi:hypothetical protein
MPPHQKKRKRGKSKGMEKKKKGKENGVLNREFAIQL